MTEAQCAKIQQMTEATDQATERQEQSEGEVDRIDGVGAGAGPASAAWLMPVKQAKSVSALCLSGCVWVCV